MGLTRSKIIARARARILNGATDPMWSSQEWGDLFQDALDRVWHELLLCGEDFFVTRRATVPHVGSGVYTLPSDFFALLWVEEPNGSPVYNVGSYHLERVELKCGYRLNGQSLLLVNWDSADYPTSLVIDYQTTPKEMDDWDGTDDPTTDNGTPPAPITTYEPDWPLNTQRGGRLLAKIMSHLAKAKDRTMTPEEDALVSAAIEDFVSHFRNRNQAGPKMPRP
mgnify:CR=1 FL=1